MRSVRLLCKTPGELIFRPIFSNQETQLHCNINLKVPCAVYMTTTKANLVWEEKHTNARQA